MKNLLIGLCIIGLTNLSYSQELYSKVDPTEHGDRSISYVNSNYINKVQSVTISKQVKLLEELVSRFDITNNRKFDGRKASFKVRFNGRTGYIIASFNNKGEILKSTEKFKDIRLPIHVLQSISRAYPNASILSTTYTVSYNSESGAKMNYSVKIRKGNLRKRIKIDSNGGFI